MSAITDLQTSVNNLTTTAVNFIAAETAAIAAANSGNNPDPAIEAAVANINTVTANLTAAMGALPTNAPASVVSPAAATQALSPANPAPPVPPVPPAA